MPNELNRAEQLIETAPDSALQILKHVSPSSIKQDRNRALYNLLLFEVSNKKKLPIHPDSLNFSIDYYQKHPDNDRLATCYLYKGRAYKYVFQYEKAMDYYLKALDEEHDSHNSTLLGRVNLDLGDIYNIQGDYAVARQKYSVAYNYFLNDKNQQLAFYALLYQGKTYHDAKDYKTADRFYRRIVSQAKDSLQQGALLQEIGLNFFDSNQTDSALIYFHRIIYFPYQGNNRALRYYYLANLYFDIKQIDSAYFFASNTFKYQPQIRTQRDCYRILTNCEFKRNHMKEMSMYMNKYVNLSDSIRKIDAQIKGSYMETTHIAKKEADKNRHLAWYLGGLVLLVLIIGYVSYKLFKSKSRKEKIQMSETHAEKQIRMHKKIIEDKRNDLHMQLENRKQILLTEYKNAGSQEREFQLRKIYKDVLHYDELELFYAEMDRLLNELVTKLQQRYSKLSEKELILCCYLMLHIPTYDMLILFGYKSDDGLKSLKKRLPPKFDIKNATLLEDFLLGIMTED
jgi:tetratricopeptide (TPR) repeat protein